MNAIMLLVVISSIAYQQVTKKIYGAKAENGAYLFSAMSSFAAALFFVLSSGFKFSYSAEAFVYSVLFALTYGVAVLCSFLAIATGPLSLSSLMLSYSTALPAVYGVVFLDEKLENYMIIGLVLLCVSLFFVNYEKGAEKKIITLKWAVFAFAAFLGNGACSIVQKVQQINCNKMYKNEFMIVALLMVSAVLFLFAVFREKKTVTVNFKVGFVWFASCGFANGLANLLVLVLATRMPASIMFPLISAGGIVASMLVALFVYKEKLSVYQYIGVVLALPSIVLLSI